MNAILDDSVDRVLVTYHDVENRRQIGSLFRVDSLASPLPVTDRHLGGWSRVGETSPLHVIDLNRVDFVQGRRNASARAEYYAAAGLTFANSPRFERVARPPIRLHLEESYWNGGTPVHRRSRVARYGNTLDD